MNNVYPFKRPVKKQIDDDHELFDINELITDGQSGCMAYLITGTSDVDFIKRDYRVFVNPRLEPKKGDLIVFLAGGKNCVGRFDGIKPVGFYGVAVGHLAVYGK